MKTSAHIPLILLTSNEQRYANCKPTSTLKAI